MTDEGAEIDPVPGGSGGHLHEPAMARLSQIVAEFNQRWGKDFTDADRVAELIQTIPDQVIRDVAYQNARIEPNTALLYLIMADVRTNTEMYKGLYRKRRVPGLLKAMIFDLTYKTTLARRTESLIK